MSILSERLASEAGNADDRMRLAVDEGRHETQSSQQLRNDLSRHAALLY